jgi:hypothetical protein
LRWHNPRAWARDEPRHTAVEVAGWRLLHADQADRVPGERDIRAALDREWKRRAA